MWTRAQLKSRAKAALNANYWKMVLVAAVITLLGGGSVLSFQFVDWQGISAGNITDGSWEDSLDGFNFYEGADGFLGDGTESDVIDPDYTFPESEITYEGFITMVILGILAVALVISLIVGVVSLAVTACLVNPLEVGADRFFVKSLNAPADMKEVLYTLDHSYLNVVKVMFCRTIFTFFWSLLLVIPGIIKSYEYRMIPYLLAENPNLTKKEAFALSKQMMMGQKWDTFVLDLSFFGWSLLGGLTCGVLNLFYVYPYQRATNAALYDELSAAHGRPARNTWDITEGNVVFEE